MMLAPILAGIGCGGRKIKTDQATGVGFKMKAILAALLVLVAMPAMAASKGRAGPSHATLGKASSLHVSKTIATTRRPLRGRPERKSN